MSRTDLRGATLTRSTVRAALPRADFDVAAALLRVRPICEAVRSQGATALADLSERFDGVRPARLRVPAPVLAAALAQLDPGLRDALDEAIRRVRLVHADQ
ncbi:MAG TPA: histidinol dehydrogenase, partial [Kineosporiaceae bacterium]|nr:histidinol dehydrogenase [Kineosporiaceae bacterium]